LRIISIKKYIYEIYKKTMRNNHKGQKGQIIIVGIVFFAIMILFSTATLRYVSTYQKSEHQNVEKVQALQLAEAGMDKAAYQLNQDSGYAGESNTALGNGTFTTSVTTVNSTTRAITATGYIPDSSNPQAVSTIKATMIINDSVISFNYGVQSGNGGFVMNGGATVNGNIYSNGNIVATNGVHITGSATAANPPASHSDQANNSPVPISSCTGSTCITFANATSTQDFAQSFKLSAAEPMNNITFYIKKVGAPSNIAVKIVNDSSGSPGSEVLLSGSLLASAVTTNFGWVTVTMPSTPILNSNQTYWMVLDASSNASKYYILGANSGSYSNGVGKIGRYGTSWSDTTPSGLDGYFQIYLGGNPSTLGGSTYVGGVYVGTTGADIAWAHNVVGASVAGDLYCQTGSYNNKTCNTSRPDPTPQPLPLSDANIQEWKDDASLGEPISGDYHVGYAGATLGPKEITGNLLIDGGGTLTVTGTLYIHGTITLTGGGKVKLAASYGSSNGVIVSDGRVTLEGGSSFSGSGEAGSYPFVITTSACPVASGCSGNDAISLSGGAGTVALIAQEGNVLINGGSALKAVTGKQITMSGGATLIYDSGLVNANFTSGPGGSWEYQPGSYVIAK
jgi:Tfp pilus assembly protein PilX